MSKFYGVFGVRFSVKIDECDAITWFYHNYLHQSDMSFVQCICDAEYDYVKFNLDAVAHRISASILSMPGM